MSDKVKGTTTTITTGDAPAPSRELSAQERAWEENTLRPTLEKSPERQKEFTTISGYPIRRLYTPADLPGWKTFGIPFRKTSMVFGRRVLPTCLIFLWGNRLAT